MKRIGLFIIVVFSTCFLTAQSPHSFKYQAIVRDANGSAMINTSVGVMINLFQDSCNGNNIYRESFVVTSNNYGLINLNIGEGSQISPNSLGSINWATGPYFIETAIDLTGGGSNHQVMTCNQLLSVPYALYAETSGSSTPGPQGIQGDPGPPGVNGVGVDSTVDNGNGTITFYYSDFTSFTTTDLTGPIGLQGQDGLQGLQGVGIDSTIDNNNGTFTLYYSDGSSFTTSDLTGPQGDSATDNQQLTIDTLNVLQLENGGSVDLQPFLDNVDSQQLAFDSLNLYLGISGGNLIDISFLQNTDNQHITLQNDTLFIDNANYVDLNTIAANEINDLIDGSTEGFNNVFLGDSSGISVVDAVYNTGVGKNALQSVSTTSIHPNWGSYQSGAYNTAIGANSQKNTDDGVGNTSVGAYSVYQNIAGSYNTAIGFASQYQSGGSSSTSVGAFTLQNNLGSGNNAFGVSSLQNNTTGQNNSAFGGLGGNTTGSFNSSFGNALASNTTGSYNTGIGYAAVGGSTYSGNTGVGYGTLNVNGGYNTAIGYSAGSLGGWPNYHGEYNVFIGANSGWNGQGDYKLYIASSATPWLDDPLIYGEFDNEIVEINGNLKVRDSLETDFLKINCCFSNVNAGVSKYILTHNGNGNTLWEDATAVVPHQDLQLNGNTLTLSNDPTPQGIDLSPYLGNTSPQNLSLSGTILSLSQSSLTVDLSNLVTSSSSNWSRDINNNEIYPVNINDEVGIGTQNPQMPLHIKKTDNVNFSNNLNSPIESELLMLENRNDLEAGYQSVSISLNGLYNDAKIIGGNEDFYGSDGYLAINTTQNGSSTEKFRITANGNIGMGTASPNNNLDIENNVAIGQNYAGSKDAPINGLMVEGSTRMGISDTYMNLSSPVNMPSEQLWVNVSPTDSSYTFGMVSTMHATHNNDKYSIFTTTGDEGTGNHYGITSNTYGNVNSSNEVFGVSSIVNHKGSGDSYGLYIDNNSTGTGDEYGIYIQDADENFMRGRLHVIHTTSGPWYDYSSYSALIENTSSSSSAYSSSNGLAIKLGSNSIDKDNNYITFFDKNNSVKGAIEGMNYNDLVNYDFEYGFILDEWYWELATLVAEGIAAGIQLDFAEVVSCQVSITSGTIFVTAKLNYLDNSYGINYQSGNADYAEWLEKKDLNEKFTFGDVVEVIGGKISKDITGNGEVMVISRSPIVLGNMPNKEDEHKFEMVAFLGQVKVKVRGEVEIGDYILSSTNNDGIAIAKSKVEMKINDYQNVVGVAWEKGLLKKGVNLVNTAIGINSNDLTHELNKTNETINELINYLQENDPEFQIEKMNSLSKAQISQPRNQNSVSNDTNLLSYEEFVFSVKEKLKTDPHFLTKFFEPIKKELLSNNVDLTRFPEFEKLLYDSTYFFEFMDKYYRNK